MDLMTIDHHFAFVDCFGMLPPFWRRPPGTSVLTFLPCHTTAIHNILATGKTTAVSNFSYKWEFSRPTTSLYVELKLSEHLEMFVEIDLR